MAVSSECRPAMAPSTRRAIKKTTHNCKEIGDAVHPVPSIIHLTCVLTPQDAAHGRDIASICFLCVMSIRLCHAGIPMEEDEDESDTSIKGRLLMLVNKIKGQSHKAEEPTETEQAAPCESLHGFT